MIFKLQKFDMDQLRGRVRAADALSVEDIFVNSDLIESVGGLFFYVRADDPQQLTTPYTHVRFVSGWTIAVAGAPNEIADALAADSEPIRNVPQVQYVSNEARTSSPKGEVAKPPLTGGIIDLSPDSFVFHRIRVYLKDYGVTGEQASIGLRHLRMKVEELSTSKAASGQDIMGMSLADIFNYIDKFTSALHADQRAEFIHSWIGREHVVVFELVMKYFRNLSLNQKDSNGKD